MIWSNHILIGKQSGLSESEQSLKIEIFNSLLNIFWLSALSQALCYAPLIQR